MAIAKNLALHGVWGLHPDSFAAASSSPLWTSLLAATFILVGVHEVVPLVLNTTSAVICIVAVGFILRRERISGLQRTLHILLTLVVAWSCSDLVRTDSGKRVAALCALAAMMVATRYEGLFVVGCAIVLAATRHRIAAVGMLAAGALPVVCVGLWNLSHGWFFLPTSIMMKQTVLPGGVGGTLWSSVLRNVVHSDRQRPSLRCSRLRWESSPIEFTGLDR
jgi:hypothetical protein